MEDCLVQDMFNAKAFRIIQSLDIKSLQKRFDKEKTMDSKWEKGFVTLLGNIFFYKALLNGIDDIGGQIRVKTIFRLCSGKEIQLCF